MKLRPNRLHLPHPRAAPDLLPAPPPRSSRRSPARSTPDPAAGKLPKPSPPAMPPPELRPDPERRPRDQPRRPASCASPLSLPLLASPPRATGVKSRSVGYLAHWLLGVAVCAVGVANVYIGLHTYRERTDRSVGLWTALLTAEVSPVALVYLLQDRWNHIVRQEEAAAGDERRSETDTSEEPSYPANDHKEVPVMP
ncbi:cytochrome b561 domain-containing protein [Hordeum vulgare]|nr:cytochrome b561 domain-containing protein [Hordeum vulgare]